MNVDLPTEFPNGDKMWYKNGKLHRENDLPAIEYKNGDRVWFIDGNNIGITNFQPRLR